MKKINADYEGILYMLIASFAFALMGMFAKVLGRDFDNVEVVFFRNFLGLGLILISILKNPVVETGGKPLLLIFRGLIGTIALYGFSYNLIHLSLGEAFTFYQTSSLFIALLSYFFLKERLNLYAWLAIFIGFLGIIVIFRPDPALMVSNCLGIFCGLGSALAYMSVSELKKYYDTRTVVLSFVASGSILPFFSMLIGQFYPNPNLSFCLGQFQIPWLWSQWLSIVMIGLTALTGQIYATKAYGAAKAGIVSGISYSNILFSLLLGWMIGDTLPSFWTWVGIGLIVLSGVLMTQKGE
ncbi:MAG: hypothetical protein RLZZ292_2597 [Bacteroidota bacterium]|jgi:drug/metabolite transporter (DMT)-like permease